MQDPKSVERLRHGDVATLKRLFKANHAKLYPLVFRLTRDRQVTDEIIRDAFKKLWADRKEIEPLETIFLRLIKYCSDFAQAYRNEHGIAGIEGGARTDAGQNLIRQLDKLPENTRLDYLLHVVDGYSVREISRAFGKSEDETKESIGRALVLLDREFEGALDRQIESTDGDLWP
jgi:RNA polymerase sigma-70 factor (ECF subfamily)